MSIETPYVSTEERAGLGGVIDIAEIGGDVSVSGTVSVSGLTKLYPSSRVLNRIESSVSTSSGTETTLLTLNVPSGATYGLVEVYTTSTYTDANRIRLAQYAYGTSTFEGDLWLSYFTAHSPALLQFRMLPFKLTPYKTYRLWGLQSSGGSINMRSYMFFLVL
ncbi:MAG: hypothetical protein QHH15_07915 [Candidatus Thermoplasmatota archaeon]|nr:hypothetical protein [Candidatus Thermoplasmatota archaeon]